MITCKAGSKNKIVTLIALLIVVVTATGVLLLCTTSAPVAPGKTISWLRLTLVDSSATQVVYTGKCINAFVESQDTIVLDLENVITLHSIKTQFYLTPEAIAHKRVKSFTLPIFWKEKTNLPYDSSKKMAYDTFYFQNGLKQSNVARVYVKNLAPFIDSLMVGKSGFFVVPNSSAGMPFTYTISDTSTKDIALKLIARDPDGNVVSYSWKNTGNASYLVWNPNVTPHNAIYHPPANIFRDTVTVMVYDPDAGSSASVAIVRPAFPGTRIDSLRFADTTYKDNASLLHIYASWRIDTIRARVYSPSAGANCRWQAKNGLIINSPGDTLRLNVTYVCTLQTKKDTLKSDTMQFVDSIKVTLKSTYSDSIVKIIRIMKKKPGRLSDLSGKIPNDSAGIGELYQDFLEPNRRGIVLPGRKDPDRSKNRLLKRSAL